MGKCYVAPDNPFFPQCICALKPDKNGNIFSGSFCRLKAVPTVVDIMPPKLTTASTTTIATTTTATPTTTTITSEVPNYCSLPDDVDPYGKHTVYWGPLVSGGVGRGPSESVRGPGTVWDSAEVHWNHSGGL